MSMEFIKIESFVLLREIKMHKDIGNFDSLSYKDLIKLHDYLQKANAILDGVIQ